MSKSRKYNYNLDVFYREDALSWYLLGAWMTDGCVKNLPRRKATSISSKDEDWIKKIRDLICPELPIYKEKNKDCYALTIYSTELSNWLILKGCIPKKSLILEFPKVPKKYLPDFIRGCIDGDGCIGFYKNNNCSTYSGICYLCSCSPKFMIEYKSILILNNFKILEKISDDRGKTFFFKDRAYTRNSIYTRINISGQGEIKRFLQWIYYDNNPLAMPRKENIAKQIINYVNN